jgi:hypothetical protein
VGRIDVQIPPTVALGDSGEDVRVGGRLLGKEQQESDGVLEQVVLPREIRVREERLDLRGVRS